MRITHVGHACLLIESGQTRLLVDPGTYSPGFEDLTRLDAVAVTHQHPDHVDPERLPVLRRTNPAARLLLETEAFDAIDLREGEVTRMRTGDEVGVGGLSIRAVGGTHAANHDQVPPVGNVGFLIRSGDKTLFHPGDSYDETPGGVDILALPLHAPWCRMSETLDFLRAVSARVAVPVHDGLLNDAGRAAYLMHVRQFGPAGTEIVDLHGGKTYDV